MTLPEAIRLIAALVFTGGSVYFLYAFIRIIGDDSPNPPYDR